MAGQEVLSRSPHHWRFSATHQSESCIQWAAIIRDNQALWLEPISSFFVIETSFSALKICFDSKSTMSLLLALLSSKRLSVFEKWLPIHSLATSRSQSSSRRAVGAGGARGAGGTSSRSVNAISTRRADYTHHIITCPPSRIYRTSYGPVTDRARIEATAR